MHTPEQYYTKIQEFEADRDALLKRMQFERNESKFHLLKQKKVLLEKEISYNQRCLDALYGEVALQ
jgi:hypothetical protein